MGAIFSTVFSMWLVGNAAQIPFNSWQGNCTTWLDGYPTPYLPFPLAQVQPQTVSYCVK